jgi:hypothetical protein
MVLVIRFFQELSDILNENNVSFSDFIFYSKKSTSLPGVDSLPPAHCAPFAKQFPILHAFTHSVAPIVLANPLGHFGIQTVPPGKNILACGIHLENNF